MAWLDGSDLGPSAEAFVRYGIGDAVDLDLQILTSFHPFQPDAKMASDSGADTSALPWLAGVAPGLTYRWDVLQVVPCVGAAVALLSSHGIAAYDGTQFGVSGRAGVDYLLSRTVVLSVQASAHFALTESPIPSPWIQLGVGAGYVWGW